MRPGRADHHVRAGLDALDLLLVADTAVDRHRAHAPVASERGDLVGDLVGELARRREHQRLTMALLRVDRLGDRDAERAGLAAAGVRLDDQVVTGPHLRDHLLLDGRGAGPPEIANAAQDRLGESAEQAGRSHP